MGMTWIISHAINTMGHGQYKTKHVVLVIASYDVKYKICYIPMLIHLYYIASTKQMLFSFIRSPHFIIKFWHLAFI